MAELSRAKKHRIAEKFAQEIGAVEPTKLDPKRYNIELMLALNYYNVQVDNKVKKKWSLEYVKKNHPQKLPLIIELGDYYFHTLGAVIRMKNIGVELEQRHLDWIENKIDYLVRQQEKMKSETSPLDEATESEKNNVTNIQKRIVEKSHEFASELDHAVDEYIVKDIPLPSIDNMLKANNVSRMAANHLPKYYAHIIEELKVLVTSKDAQLNEAWSHVPRAKVKKLLAWYLSIEETVKIYGVTIKVRKPRAKKVKPAGVVAKNVKYLVEDKELGLKSESPVDMVNASEIWIFDTKYRKLARYVGDGITVKGTTLVNFEPEKSTMKTVRKPETMLKELLNTTRKKMEMTLRDIKGATYIPTGRINPNCIILKVFK